MLIFVYMATLGKQRFVVVDMVIMIETFSNPQQSWGDQRTQGAINVVP